MKAERASARRSTGLLCLVLFVSILVASSPASGAKPEPLNHYVGALHEHSGYSDGWPGTKPADYFASAKGYGLDFLGSGEHSDNADVPVTASDGCTDPALAAKCVLGGGEEPIDSLRKWDATLDQARDATVKEKFTGFRGFEWTSDRFGHINVYFSKNDTNAKADGGYAGTMETFWNWFRTSPDLDGGSDGLATFNHPDAKRLIEKEVQRVAPSFKDPATNWNDFEYVPEADDRMVGIEVYNDEDEFGTTRGPKDGPGFYVHALDKGWHLGAVGAEDLHGKPETNRSPADNQWGHRLLPKTVIIASDRSAASLRAAMHARRFYAIQFNEGLRIDFTVDRAMMGSRLVRPVGKPLSIEASTNQPGLQLEVVTSGGRIAATGTSSIKTMVRASGGDRYYFLRVIDPSQPPHDRYVAYSSPVWIEAQGPEGPTGEWLAGDLHVHTCYSHDAYCPPDDYNTGPEDFFTLSGNVEERFIEASARGLDYLAITDHHDDRRPNESGAGAGPAPPPWEDPGFGTHGVIGIPGYENSLSGHAQMLGATKVYWLPKKADGSGHPDMSPAAVQTIADELRADGGVFQANHPTDPPHDLRDELSERVEDPASELPPLVPLACDNTGWMDWGYAFDVTVDTVEVWNFSHYLQPPIPAMSGNGDAIRYWECWLQLGAKVGATGGSDSHWLSTTANQGPGNPTTWIFARDRSLTSILQALKEGRTSVSILPPTEGAIQLYLEADGDGDGNFESIVGDVVAPGSKMRVRASGLPGAGFVEIRANGQTIHTDEPLLPGGEFTFDAPPNQAGWVRATLAIPDGKDARIENCEPEPVVSGETTYCREQIFLAALTSPIYLGTVSEEELSESESTSTGSEELNASSGAGSEETISVLPISKREFGIGEALLLVITLLVATFVGARLSGFSRFGRSGSG